MSLFNSPTRRQIDAGLDLAQLAGAAHITPAPGAAPETMQGQGGEFGGEVARFLQIVFLRGNFRNQTDGERFLSADGIADENHFFRFGGADQTGQSLRATAAGKGADLDFR